MLFRKLILSDMERAAKIHRQSFDHQMPWLAGLHTPDEDRYFYEKIVFAECTLWGAADSDDLVGIIAFTRDWIEQLYVIPEFQGRGAGSGLLAIAQAEATHLKLWTFQKNAPARRFYEARGFVAMEQTDGSRNEEKEPDVLYAWSKPAGDDL